MTRCWNPDANDSHDTGEKERERHAGWRYDSQEVSTPRQEQQPLDMKRMMRSSMTESIRALSFWLSMQHSMVMMTLPRNVRRNKCSHRVGGSQSVSHTGYVPGVCPSQPPENVISS